MGLRKKHTDPFSDRERQIKAEIAAIEGQIRKLSAAVDRHPAQPRIRSTVLPHQASEPAAARIESADPIFETVDHQRIKASRKIETAGGSASETELRKLNLIVLWNRIGDFFRGPKPSNPKLLSLLAAGNVQGLRPLRYEKRIARNRLFIWVVVFLLIMWILIDSMLKSR